MAKIKKKKIRTEQLLKWPVLKNGSWSLELVFYITNLWYPFFRQSNKLFEFPTYTHKFRKSTEKRGLTAVLKRFLTNHHICVKRQKMRFTCLFRNKSDAKIYMFCWFWCAWKAIKRYILCLTESFNLNISHQLFDYTITFVNLQL